MRFIIKTDSNIKKDSCELTCNAQDYDYLKELLCYLQKRDTRMIVYDDEHNMYMLPLAQIYYIECVDNKTFIYTKRASFRSYQHFSVLKKMYQQLGFRQINKNTIVNTHYIVTVKIVEDCRRLISLENDEQLIVNRNFRDFLNDLICR